MVFNLNSNFYAEKAIFVLLKLLDFLLIYSEIKIHMVLSYYILKCFIAKEIWIQIILDNVQNLFKEFGKVTKVALSLLMIICIGW